jgi:hypothetical protein
MHKKITEQILSGDNKYSKGEKVKGKKSRGLFHCCCFWQQLQSNEKHKGTRPGFKYWLCYLQCQ